MAATDGELVQYRANGELTALWMPAPPPGVVWSHQATFHARRFLQPEGRYMIEPVVERGCLVTTPDLAGGRHWGSDESVAAFDDAVAHLRSVGARPGPIGIIAASMGTLPAVEWARRHLDQVGAMAFISPVLDLADLHDQDRCGIAASIDEALTGAGGFAYVEERRNPIRFAAELPGIPLGIWWSPTDPVIVGPTVTAFARAHRSVEVHDMGNVGHAVTAEAAIGAAEFVASRL